MHHMLPKLHLTSSRGEDKSDGSHKHSRKESRDDIRARENEKNRLAAWEANKRPLEYDQILVDPSQKPVGHSSKVLRREDFELIKTLGTGTSYILQSLRRADCLYCAWVEKNAKLQP